MVDRIRIVVAGATSGGPDGRGASIARALRDAGTEVVWTGSGQLPEQIVRTVVQEDADALVVVLDGGTDKNPLRRTVALLLQHDAADVAVFGVGPDAGTDAAEHATTPAVTIFPAGAGADDIVVRIHADVGARGDA